MRATYILGQLPGLHQTCKDQRAEDKAVGQAPKM